MRGNILGIVEIVFAMIYLGLGLFLLLEPKFLTNLGLPESYSIGLGIILLGYAVFRFYRVSTKFRKNENDRSI